MGPPPARASTDPLRTLLLPLGACLAHARVRRGCRAFVYFTRYGNSAGGLLRPYVRLCRGTSTGGPQAPGPWPGPLNRGQCKGHAPACRSAGIQWSKSFPRGSTCRTYSWTWERQAEERLEGSRPGFGEGGAGGGRLPSHPHEPGESSPGLGTGHRVQAAFARRPSTRGESALAVVGGPGWGASGSRAAPACTQPTNPPSAEWEDYKREKQADRRGQEEKKG